MSKIIRLVVVTGTVLTGSVIAQEKTLPYCNEQESAAIQGGLYIKYRITDEWIQEVFKKDGAPAHVRGDELRELVIADGFRYERLYGKSWVLDDGLSKLLEQLTKEMEGYVAMAERGEYVPEEVFADMVRRMNAFQPKSEPYPYDRISVFAPTYTLHYNRVNQVGYGYETINNPGQITKKDEMENKRALKDMIDIGMLDAAKNMGKVTELKETRTILGHTCTMNVTNTDMFDYSRKYKQIEACTATINGNKVDLYTVMGKAGERYIIEAVEINENYMAKGNLFCAPQYVTFK